MYKVERRGLVGYEDLMRELEAFEQELFQENRPMAMNMMVLEAKIRERFQHMENKVWETYANINLDENPLEKELSMAEIEAMVPLDLPLFPSTADLKDIRKRKRMLQTIGMAALLAVVTAVGVFGLASLLQLTISWIA
jgi:hypothetical protein